ncbi:MAG: hypothetical protein D6712_08945 [Chloroflexi bacterium]|nr:MAG: hypothetical protein D6712_08945 [Chloroflexota bacterium]
MSIAGILCRFVEGVYIPFEGDESAAKVGNSRYTRHALFFGKVYPPMHHKLSYAEARAYIDVMVAAMVCDGVMRQQELERLIANVAARPSLRKFDPEQIERMINTSLTEFQGMTRARLDNKLAAIANTLKSTPNRKDALRMAISVMRANKEISPKALTFLRRLATALGIDEAEVKKLLQNNDG